MNSKSKNGTRAKARLVGTDAGFIDFCAMPDIGVYMANGILWQIMHIGIYLAHQHTAYSGVTASQLHRQARYHNGQDVRRKPYMLLGVRIDAQPVLLK